MPPQYPYQRQTHPYEIYRPRGPPPHHPRRQLDFFRGFVFYFQTPQRSGWSSAIDELKHNVMNYGGEVTEVPWDSSTSRRPGPTHLVISHGSRQDVIVPLSSGTVERRRYPKDPRDWTTEDLVCAGGRIDSARGVTRGLKMVVRWEWVLECVAKRGLQPVNTFEVMGLVQYEASTPFGPPPPLPPPAPAPVASSSTNPHPAQPPQQSYVPRRIVNVVDPRLAFLEARRQADGEKKEAQETPSPTELINTWRHSIRDTTPLSSLAVPPDALTASTASPGPDAPPLPPCQDSTSASTAQEIQVKSEPDTRMDIEEGVRTDAEATKEAKEPSTRPTAAQEALLQAQAAGKGQETSKETFDEDQGDSDDDSTHRPRDGRFWTYRDIDDPESAPDEPLDTTALRTLSGRPSRQPERFVPTSSSKSVQSSESPTRKTCVGSKTSRAKRKSSAASATSTSKSPSAPKGPARKKHISETSTVACGTRSFSVQRKASTPTIKQSTPQPMPPRAQSPSTTPIATSSYSTLLTFHRIPLHFYILCGGGVQNMMTILIKGLGGIVATNAREAIVFIVANAPGIAAATSTEQVWLMGHLASTPGKVCVSSKWIEECASRGQSLDPTPYFVRFESVKQSPPRLHFPGQVCDDERSVRSKTSTLTLESTPSRSISPEPDKKEPVKEETSVEKEIVAECEQKKAAVAEDTIQSQIVSPVPAGRRDAVTGQSDHYSTWTYNLSVDSNASVTEEDVTLSLKKKEENGEVAQTEEGKAG